MLFEQSKQVKKQAEDILKEIESHNKMVEKAISIEKVICRRMKELIRSTHLLQKEPLPLAAKAKITQYQAKYTQFENLGIIVGHVKQTTQRNHIISHDGKYFNDIANRFERNNQTFFP